MNNIVNTSNQTPIEIALLDIHKNVLKCDISKCYGIINEETLKRWTDVKNETTEENINRFINSLGLDDFIKIVYKMLDTEDPPNIKFVEDFVYNYFYVGLCSKEVYKLLRDACDYKWFYLVEKCKGEKINIEKEYVDKIVENFSDIFPDFIGTEYIVEKIGRIDILAREKKSSLPVIIECKVKNHNPTKQLLAYGSHFRNPKLIGITEKKLQKKSQHDNILYLTYKDLGIGGGEDE